ncbi:MAG: hypothetical protein ACREAB_00225 [Blastocatellia bacterium]
MERSKELLQLLAQQIAEHHWVPCSELYFRVTYGLPGGMQIDLARLAINGYLPIFEKKWPAVKWPRQLLQDVEQWVGQYGRQLPDEPDDPDPADAAFLSSLDGLLLAASYRGDPFTLTSSCASAINSAINARQSNVWMADDPEGVEMWKTQQYFPGRSVIENVAAIAVAEREWKKVAEWLEERQVWNIPEEADEEEIEKALARWKEHEMLPVVPGS